MELRSYSDESHSIMNIIWRIIVRGQFSISFAVYWRSLRSAAVAQTARQQAWTERAVHTLKILSNWKRNEIRALRLIGSDGAVTRRWRDGEETVACHQ